MTYRILPIEEWDRLLPLFAGHEADLPSPEVAGAAVAEDEDGEIQGVLVFQLVFHMEPLILRNPHVSFVRLKETLDKALVEHKGLQYYVFAGNGRTERMAVIAGLQPTGYTAWKGQVE